MSLEMKDACETCAAPLDATGAGNGAGTGAGNAAGNAAGTGAGTGAGDAAAYICSWECTFCSRCTTETHNSICPNCGGELVPRPRRRTV